MMQKRKFYFDVIAGTYEEYLIVYTFYKENEEFKLDLSVANHTHKASLRAVACNQKYIISGGADENAHIYDVVNRKESGVLSHHSGTITGLKFTDDGSYLISSSEDGSLALINSDSWQLLEVWPKAHEGKAVNGFAIHPSGNLAMSVGNDSKLRVWNLVTRKQEHSINLVKKCKRPEKLEFSKAGTYYSLAYGSFVELFDMKNPAPIFLFNLSTSVSAITFIKDDSIVVGEADGKITCFDCKTGKKQWMLEGNGVRVKSISVMSNWLVAANSSGTFCVYNLLNQPPEVVVSAETQCRVTCMVLLSLEDEDKDKAVEKKKRKRDLLKIQKRNNKKLRQTVACCPASQKWTVEPLSSAEETENEG